MNIIKFEWKTKYTHPQNATGWNVETTNADMDRFDFNNAQSVIERNHPSLCDADANEVTIGRIWAIVDGEEIAL